MLVKLGIPVLAANALSFSVIIAPLFSLGHLGTQYLAAVALATMFCSVTGFSVGSGLTTALDTLCSQSLTGSSDKHALGKHLQRALFVQLLLCIPVIIIWNFAEPVLILFGQDIEIARIAGQFVKFLMPGLYPYLANRCLVSYLQAQGIMDAGLFIMLVAAPTNALFQWALVWAPNLNIGANGAPLATSLTNILVFALTSAYIYFVKGGDRFGGFEYKEIFDFRQIWIYIKLGIPGVIMVCSEWWAFEIVALAAGWISDEVLAAQSITLNVCTFLFYFPLGISIAANTRIG
jgi:MATE family multidrug resistance protein